MHKRARLSFLLAALAVAVVSLSSAEAHAQYVDLTPPSGTLVQTNAPGWAMKGYLVTAQQNVTITALQWWIVLPAGVSVAARIYNNAGTLVASGPAVFGNGTEQWYQSNVNFTFVTGQTYTVAFYHSACTSGTFDRKDNLTQGFNVLPQFTAVNSRSNCATPQSDVFPDCSNCLGPLHPPGHRPGRDLWQRHHRRQRDLRRRQLRRRRRLQRDVPDRVRLLLQRNAERVLVHLWRRPDRQRRALRRRQHHADGRLQRRLCVGKRLHLRRRAERVLVHLR